MKPRLVVTRQLTPQVEARIANEFDAFPISKAGLTVDEAVDAANSFAAEALLITAAFKLDANVIKRLPSSLKIVATCSVGFDHIDVNAAKAEGLIVTNTPDVLNAATADLAFLLMLGACRRIGEYDRHMRAGWSRMFGMTEMLGVDIEGKTLGIIGMGRIGQALARRARAFDMKIAYHNRNRLPPETEEGATYYSDLNQMLPECDVLSVHAPGGEGTRNLINEDVFAKLPKGAVFVNTSRGTLVDEDALIRALQSGDLYAAGLDVFWGEPKIDPRFAELPNVLLAPHMGSATAETRTAMGARSLKNIEAVLGGGKPLDPLWT